MNISESERYKLINISDTFFEVVCAKGTSNFSGIATSKKPKLYIVSVNEIPIYVGITKQSMRNRLRLGWNANGENGYHGYAWRRGLFNEVNLDIWCHEDAPEGNSTLDIETIEAEVVFLIRRDTQQWPLHQTEIHFHPSTPIHREIASRIMKTYDANIPKER